MKRFFILFILLLLTFNALAINACSEETATVPINTEDTYFIGLAFSYDPYVFDFISNNRTRPNTQFSKYKMIMCDIYSLIPFSEIETIMLQIKEDAEIGEYKIPVELEAWALDEEAAQVEINIGTINIKEVQYNEKTSIKDFLQFLIKIFWSEANE